jgi:polyhydroxyalkanoate synthesis regulator phasin
MKLPPKLQKKLEAEEEREMLALRKDNRDTTARIEQLKRSIEEVTQEIGPW